MFRLEFSTDNIAFKQFSPDDIRFGLLSKPSAELTRAAEVYRIIGVITSEVMHYTTSGVVKDHNGNTIGEWSLTEEGE